MVSVAEIFNRGKYIASSNGAGILTGIGVTGTISTAYLTGRASFNAALIIDKAEPIKEDLPGVGLTERERTLKEKIELVWPQYIPPVGVGITTILAIIMANRVASKEAAALAAAYGLSERAFQEYKEKVTEKLGEGKERAVRDEIAQDRVNKHPINTKELILAGTGEVLCMDLLTGRYFQSTMEKIRQAENKVNYEIVNVSYASLSTFYDEIGLPPTGMSDILGFNLDNRLELRFSAVMSTDNRPCMAIEFRTPPVPDYGKHVY